VCRSILRDEPIGNWHKYCLPTEAPANACWRFSAWMLSVQASSTFEYLSSDYIGHGVLVNTIASRNHFPTLNIACYSWGTFWSLLVLGCGIFWSALGLGMRNSWVQSAGSHLDNWLKRVDFWHLSSGGAIVPGGFREFRSRRHAITGLAKLRCFGSGILVVHNQLSPNAWPWSGTACWWSKLALSMLDD